MRDAVSVKLRRQVYLRLREAKRRLKARSMSDAVARLLDAYVKGGAER